MLQFLATSQRLVVSTPTGWQLVITFPTLSVLYHYRQVSNSDVEAGGVLMGRLLQPDQVGSVENVTEPGDGDRQTRYSFFRSKRHNNEVRRYWKSTNKTGTYLGLWHTHPEAKPTPSMTDISDWQKAIQRDRYSAPALLFAIVGTDELGIWSGGVRQEPDLIGRWKWDLKYV